MFNDVAADGAVSPGSGNDAMGDFMSNLSSPADGPAVPEADFPATAVVDQPQASPEPGDALLAVVLCFHFIQQCIVDSVQKY